MLLNALFSELSPLIDGARMVRHVEAIYRNDRWFDFAHFEKTARYVASELEAAGCAEVELLPLRADGATRYGDWVVPRAWDAHEATLMLLQADGRVADDGTLADYHREPCCLVMYSASAQIHAAPVVLIDDPDAFTPRDLSGCVIFTALPPGRLVAAALACGAAGIVSDFIPPYPGVRTRQDVYDAFRWENDFLCPINDTELFAFNLSPRRGDQLRAEIAKNGGATLRVSVSTDRYDGVCYTVSGLVRGHDAGEDAVMLVGHLYEPGANDNATGCAGLIELARALCRLTPPRPIRIVMGFECAGLSGYWAHHAERVSHVGAAIQMDMIGAADADLAYMHLWHNPLSNYSYLDALLPLADEAFRAFSGQTYQSTEAPYSIGDNLLADPAIGVPTVSMIMHPARSYHSSQDGMALVSADVLARNAVIAGAVALTAAGDASWVAPHIEKKLARVTQDFIAGQSKPARAELEAWALACALAKLQGDQLPPLPAAFAAPFDHPATRTVPVRLKPGTVTMSGTVRPGETPEFAPFYNYELNAPLYWMDGTRTLGEVARLWACEMNDEPDHAFNTLLSWTKALEAYGVLKLNPAY